MSRLANAFAAVRWALRVYASIVRGLVLGLAAVAGLGILAMMLVTCADVVLRMFGSPLVGTFDVIKIAGSITIACALPYTTAVKGHVAIEYFFLKLPRRGRILVDTVVRLAGIGLFGLLAWQSLRYGLALKRSGQVTATLQIPVYWVPWVIAFSCIAVALVILHNLVHPGREMIKP